jgi:HK97 family phage prohead protease
MTTTDDRPQAARRDGGCGCAQAAADGPPHFRAASVDNSSWDGPAAMSACSNSDAPASCFNAICAGKKAGDVNTQDGHALPHHKHPGDPPNATGVRNALSRLPQTDDLTNKAQAQAHLEAHLSTIQAAENAAGLPPSNEGRAAAAAERREVAQQRAAQLSTAQRDIPNGLRREQAFGSIVKASPTMKDGAQYYEVEGVASVVDTPYEMFDMWGPYDEIVTKGSFDKSMANPELDVAFLLNHRGVTMARTKNGSLSLWLSPDLSVRAFLNAGRQDVRDLVSAMSDGLIDEMSFAFWLRDGYWSDDYMTFYITEADINRGDVSAVNYGASPHTSIAARSAEIVRLLDLIPAGAARAAVDKLLARSDLAEGAGTGWQNRAALLTAPAATLSRAADLGTAPAEDLVGYEVGGKLVAPDKVKPVRATPDAPVVPTEGLFPAPSGSEKARAGLSLQMLVMQQDLADDLDGR